MTDLAPEAPPEPQFIIDRNAYAVAKAKLGIQHDTEVAKRMGVHPITLTRTLGGQGSPSEAMRWCFVRLFGSDADVIVRRQW